MIKIIADNGRVGIKVCGTAGELGGDAIRALISLGEELHEIFIGATEADSGVGFHEKFTTALSMALDGYKRDAIMDHIVGLIKKEEAERS